MTQIPKTHNKTEVLILKYYGFMYQVGDMIFLEGSGEFAPGIMCEVLALDPDGYIQKVKACNPDERLGRKGFLLEGDDYVAVVWELSMN